MTFDKLEKFITLSTECKKRLENFEDICNIFFNQLVSSRESNTDEQRFEMGLAW